MNVEKLIEAFHAEFFTGVPDSRLKPLCSYLMEHLAISDQHIIAANEGNSTGLAAGYHLATGNIPVVYLQNSGIGNILNPVVSLLNEQVYAIPCIFVIGWRGEPGSADEPQHVFQGEMTIPLLKDMGLHIYILKKGVTEKEVDQWMKECRQTLDAGCSVAFLVCEGALSSGSAMECTNPDLMKREEVIRHLLMASGEDPIICTTGKASRELFELRDMYGQSHKYDFLTVGSMGHSSSIALGIALQKKGTKIWCLDGDGAALMHLGAMAVIGSRKPPNMVHIVINNYAHESVGGMPTVASDIDFVQIAQGCGYEYLASVETLDELNEVLASVKRLRKLCFIEVRCALGSRPDLGRPTVKARTNKEDFMEFLRDLV